MLKIKSQLEAETPNHHLYIFLLCVLLDISNSIAYSSDLFCLIVWNRDTKFLLKLHNKFYCIQRISTKVVCKTCFWLYFCFVNTELIIAFTFDSISDIIVKF